MKVWLIQRSEPTPHDGSGTQRAMRMGILAQMLVNKGHQVLWWTSTFDHNNRRHRYETDTRIPVIKGYDIQYLHGCGYSKNISLKRILDNVLVANRFSELANKDPEKPDIILASIPTSELASEAVSYARRNDIPIVLDVRDLWPDVFFDILPAAFEPFIRLASVFMTNDLKKACKGATGIIGITDAFVAWGVGHAGRARHVNDRAFPMGYLVKNRPAGQVEDGKQFWHSKNCISSAINVVFIGTLGKGFDFAPIIQAARLLTHKRAPINFIICGAGENDQYIRRQAEGLDNIFFPGWVNAEQIRFLLELADIGIAPYIDRKDFKNSNPNKAAEYLSGGLAIALSLGEGALYDLLAAHGCGFSYHNDPNMLATELESLIIDPSKLANLKSNAHKTFQEFLDADVVYSNLIEYMENIVQSKK